MYRSLGSLNTLVTEVPWPVDFFSPNDLPTFLNNVLVLDYEFAASEDTISCQFWLAFAGEMAIALPGLDGVKLVIGGNTPDFTFVTVSLIIGPQTVLTFESIELALRFDPSILKPAALNPGDPVPQFVEIQVVGSVSINSSFDVNVQGFDSFKLTPAAIGDTGIIIAADDVKLDLSRTSNIPEVTAAGFDASFMGVYIGQAQVKLPDGLPALAPEDLFLKNCAIGTGGVSGRLEAHYSPVYDSTHKTFTGKGASTFFGIPFGLKDAILDIKQNAFQESILSGSILLPFFDEPVDVTLSINQDGTLSAKLTSPNGLYTLTKPGILSIQLQSIGFVVEQGTFITKLSGQITPLFGASDTPPLNWPAFQVKELSIDSKGNVHLQGGWLNLPSQYHLNFYGFTMVIEKLGFGNTSDGGKWIGFSGGITLVDGMPAGASVDGLRLTWYEDGRPPQISLNGVGITFSVPDVLDFKGSVSYDSTAQQFHGSLTLNLIALDMEVDGKAVFGVQQGQTYFALYLAAEWPAGVPLWATGLGLYGMAGLFALSMEPNKGAGDEWYGLDPAHSWYLRAPVGVIDLSKKWTEQTGAMALGAGATVGTLSDNGHAFSGRMLFVIVFPGPVLLIEGKASLLQDRARLDQDTNFRALAVLDAHAGTFTVGLDARYQYDGSGKLINIHGGVEAFFNLNDASDWNLYLGEKDRSKRIQARIFQLFEADCYVMLDAHQLAMGAWIGFNNQWSFGPLSVNLQAWLDGNAVVNWHPVHFHGDLTLHGSVGLSAFGIGLSLTVDAHLAADVFDPFHILGQFSVSLSLPWPFSPISATVTLEWGPTPTVPALPAPLLEVAVEHFKITTSWPLLISTTQSLPNPMPVVPLDSRLHITFSRPVNDDALVGVNAQPLVPDYERVGDPAQNQGPVRVRYGLQEASLWKQTNNPLQPWVEVAGKAAKFLSAGPPAQYQVLPNASGVDTLYGSWAPLPHMPDGGGQNLGQTKLWLWSKSAFDYTRHTGGTWNEWFTDRYNAYPCGPLVQTCWDFEQVAPTSPLPNPWQHPANPGLVFSCAQSNSMSIDTLSQPVEGLTHALCVSGPLNATIALPEPRNVVKIPALDSYPSYALFYGYDAQGNSYGPFSRTSSEQTTVEVRGGNMTRIGITTPVSLASGVSGAIGCAYVPQRNQLLFVEFGGGGSGTGKFSAIDLNSGTYSVLGTGYTAPEDIVVTANGNTAYVTERPGNLLRLDLTKRKLDRSQATVVSSGMTAPQQIALDEANNLAYVVEYANPGNLLRIELGSGQAAPMYGNLNNPVGLLLVSNSSTVYISEQGGNGQLSRVTFTPGTDTAHDVLFSGLTNPFFMRWGNADHTQIVLALRDPANRVALLDLSQSPVSMTTLLDGVPFRPSSLAQLPGNQIVVCSDGVVSGYETRLCLPQVCLVTADELIQHFEDELDRWSQAGEVLQPYTTYQLKITTTLVANGEGELSGYSLNQTFANYAYFSTDAPPALQTLSVPVGYPASAGPFLSGLEDLTRYVDQAAATTVQGTPGAYSVGVSFNENYVDLLYSKGMRDLAIHLYDNNGPAHDANGRLISLVNEWGRVDQLTLTESEISWLSVLSRNGCVLVDPQVILHNISFSSTIDSQVLVPQTLYEARLVPMLYHDDFSSGSFTNSLGGWQAQDTSGTSNWQTGRDGTPPAPYVTQTTGATSTLLWTPNRSGDWSDYRLNVSLRAASANPVGVVFRYLNSGQYYRFSLEPQSDPTLPPHWRLLKVVAGRPTPYDLPFSATGFVFSPGKDYLITVEALGPTVQVYQDGQLLLAATDPAVKTGSIGLYCSNNAGARFTDVRVDDFRASGPIAYKFSFTTS